MANGKTILVKESTVKPLKLDEMYKPLFSERKGDSRILWIDWLKIIGMFFIVWGHFFPEMLSAFIYSFSVPLFFFLSGYLNSNKRLSYSKDLAKTIHTLFIPMICILLINWTIDYGKLILAIPIKESMLRPLFMTALGFHSPLLHELWFVYDLIFIHIVSNFLRTSSKNKYLLFISLIFMLIIYSNGINKSISIINIWGGLFFYTLGVEIRQNKTLYNLINRLINIRKSIILLIIIPFLLVFQWHFSCINGCNFLYNASYGSNFSLSILLSFTGIILGILISSLIKINTSWLSYINTGAIFILGLHYRIISYLSSVLDIQHNDFKTFILSSLLLLGFIPCIIIAKKYIPWILGR